MWWLLIRCRLWGNRRGRKSIFASRNTTVVVILFSTTLWRMGDSYLWVLATFIFITFLFFLLIHFHYFSVCNFMMRFLWCWVSCSLGMLVLLLMQCKHQIAARLASSIGFCVDVKVSDEQLAVMLSNLWHQVRNYCRSKLKLNCFVNVQAYGLI